MKVVFISDTHNQHHSLSVPTGDVLIHAGDVSGRGTRREIEDFLQWFSAQPHTHKIFIAGNHDFFIQLSPNEFKKILPSNCIYLQDEMVEIEGFKIYGSPWTPKFMNWAFMKDPKVIEEVWRNIPKNLDILITHGPAHGILDQLHTGPSVGCSTLINKVKELKPRYFLFGHIHESYGSEVKDGTTYLNGAVLNERYYLQNKAHSFHL